MWVARGEGTACMGGIPSSMSEGLDQVLPGRNPAGVEVISFTNPRVPIKEASQRSCVGGALVEQWQRQLVGGS